MIPRRTMLLLVGPLLMLVSCAAALAQDPASASLSQPMPAVDYLLGLGPIGALVYGAFMLGKGVKINIAVEIAERDRTLIERGIGSVEAIAKALQERSRLDTPR